MNRSRKSISKRTEESCLYRGQYYNIGRWYQISHYIYVNNKYSMNGHPIHITITSCDKQSHIPRSFHSSGYVTNNRLEHFFGHHKQANQTTNDSIIKAYDSFRRALYYNL